LCAEFHVKVEDVDQQLSILEAELKSLISKNNEAEKLAGELGRPQAGFQTVLLAAGRGTSNAVLNPTITNLLTPAFVQALSEVSGPGGFCRMVTAYPFSRRPASTRMRACMGFSCTLLRNWASLVQKPVCRGRDITVPPFYPVSAGPGDPSLLAGLEDAAHSGNNFIASIHRRITQAATYSMKPRCDNRYESLVLHLFYHSLQLFTRFMEDVDFKPTLAMDVRSRGMGPFVTTFSNNEGQLLQRAWLAFTRRGLVVRDVDRLLLAVAALYHPAGDVDDFNSDVLASVYGECASQALKVR
jgi:hypothetical protein